MTGQGGETRSTLGNADPNTLLGSGVTLSGVGTINAQTLNVTTGLTVSGGTNLQNVSGFFWRGVHSSGITGLLSGVSCKGFMRMEMSGQGIYVAYWVSA